MAFRVSRRLLRLICENLPTIDIKVLGVNNLETVKGNPAIYAFSPHGGHSEDAIVYWTVSDQAETPIAFPAALKPWWTDKRLNLVGKMYAPMIPIARKKDGASREEVKESVNNLVALLNDGYSTVLAAEGTRSSKPFLERRVTSGLADLALRSGAPVVPVVLRGFSHIQTKDDRFPKLLPERREDGELHRRHVLVYFGEPVSFPQVDDPRRPDRLPVMHRLDAIYQGIYEGLEQAPYSDIWDQSLSTSEVDNVVAPG